MLQKLLSSILIVAESFSELTYRERLAQSEAHSEIVVVFYLHLKHLRT